MTTRLFGGNLLSILTATLIDASGWWEKETTARAPSYCTSGQYVFDLFSAVLKAEVFSQAFPSEFEIVDVFAYQLQEFLIQGSVEPVHFLEVKKPGWDCGEDVITFRIPSTTDLERIRTVTSASKLLASFCLGMGKMDHLRKSVYLILRYCNMDSTWLLAAMSSIATVCGKSMFLAAADDIAGQAVLVVISELLNDAEGPEISRNGTVVVDSVSGIAENAFEEKQERNSDVGSRKEVETSNSILDYLHILRSSVGKFENYLNFEVLLPTILQSFLDVISPNYLLGLRHLASDPACLELPVLSATSSRVFGVPADSAASANTANERLPQPCQEVGPRGMEGCWQCTYSNRIGVKSVFVDKMDFVNRSEDSCIAWERKFHEIAHALELVSCHLGWEWTYNDLIVEHLSKRVYPGASDVTVVFVAKSIGIFGRLGIEVDGTELQGVKELRGILHAILRSSHKAVGVDGGTCAFSLTAQIASAQSLLSLCRDIKKDRENMPASVSASYASVLAWFRALDSPSLESLPSTLRSLLISLKL